jgi:osmoprotectant transport system ATP-binding protein
VIVLDQVEKSFGGRTVLGPVSLEVPTGRRLAIVGPSGCGKSTLLRIILGLLRPDRGSVSLGGQLLGEATKLALRRRVGYVVQDGGLFPHLSAERNVTIVARYLGWDDTRVSKRVDRLAELAGLDREALQRWPAQLSGGQRQRVGVMRALILDPDVLLLDEPLGALDPLTRSRLQRELLSLFRSLDKTVILVTHDIAEAGILADETAIMREGRIVQRGAIDAIARAPADSFVHDLLQSGRP